MGLVTMELSEWCEQVPHGQYFQAIRLRVDLPEEPATSPTSPPSAASIELPVIPSTPPRDLVNGDVQPNAVAASPGLSTPKRLKRRQKPPPTPPRTPKPVTDVDRDSTLLLPPFQSAHVGVDRMVLNVGGPVWAMDWLPHDVYRATVNGGGKHKKQHAAVVNSDKETHSGNRANGSAKDPLTEWRLLALSTHPPCTVVDDKLVKNTPPDHYYDAPQGGRSLVQIWAIPVTKPPPSSRDDPRHEQPQQQTARMIPRLVYAIDHDCGVAWDLQWAPLTHKMPRYRQADGLLGVLAVAFGDGSLQIFEVPTISKEKLQAEPREVIVERLQPLGSGKVDKTIQLSARWSPHRWNLLLTGSSDGSVALWNLEELLSKPRAQEEEEAVRELEPQRRFQDADTIGKQETFDWGWGWVAIRAVCWSPFDENLFTTTGNDSLFKIWDIREPRICFRSHRIRSTWGLAIQWIDDTSIQISGDQGSLYMYDLLSGSYQKLHFHPQIDSPVWDLQFARRGQLPLLASSCTSGSLRLAPAKKLFRAPQHSVEICLLQGEKTSSVDQPHKNLRLSFEHRIVSGSAEAASPATREFCERDAALHRVRLSTHEPGEFPCFLSTGGHAGLVIIMEMQEELDHLFENYFMQPSKKIGRPRKTFEASANPWNARKSPDKEKKIVGPPKVKRVSGVKLSNFVQANAGMAGMKAKPKKAAQAAEYPEFEMESAASASASEAEYQDGEESESDSEELSLVDDNSDDDRILDSDGDESDEVEIVASPQARMRQEYQLDLSEEDAILLAIQMSELEQTAPSPAPAPTPAPPKPKAKPAVKAATPSAVLTSNEKKAPAKAKTKPINAKATETPPAKAAAKPKPSSTPDGASPGEIYVEEMDQASIQMMIYQQNMNEEEALREAIRMSEMGLMRRSHRKRKAPPTPPEPAASTPSSVQRTPKSVKRSTPPPEKKAETPVALSPDEVSRRLEFASPAPHQPNVNSVQVQASAEKKPTAVQSSRPPKAPVSAKKKTPPAKRADASAQKEKIVQANQTVSEPTGLTTAVVSTPTATVTKTTKASSATKTSVKKTPSSSAKKAKAKRSSNADMLTEEELLAIALQTSQIEY